jgi:hypothetical protein
MLADKNTQQIKTNLLAVCYSKNFEAILDLRSAFYARVFPPLLVMLNYRVSWDVLVAFCN